MEEVKYIEGDLVKLNGKPVKITFAGHIIIEYIHLDRRGGDEWRTLRKLIEPIKLTHQILEDNGWRKVHQEPVNCCEKYQKFRNVDLSYNIPTNTFCFYSFNIAGAVVTRLPYVHNLQHLLFGLNLPMDLKV